MRCDQSMPAPAIFAYSFSSAKADADRKTNSNAVSAASHFLKPYVFFMSSFSCSLIHFTAFAEKTLLILCFSACRLSRMTGLFAGCFEPYDPASLVVILEAAMIEIGVI
ncbi:MAG: hypothetical protein IJ174_06350, partial [Clostridia bacterium]|nr:hypothetical protein [Clostridia bacterium]